MTYPVIRWNGGAIRGNLPSINLGGLGDQAAAATLSPTAFHTAMSADFASRMAPTLIAAAAANQGSTADPSWGAGTLQPGGGGGMAAPDGATTSPSAANIERCDCALRQAGEMSPDLFRSALEACSVDPDNFLATLEARGLDLSACGAAGAAGETPVWQNPWVLGGAAAVVLAGVAVWALR